MSFTYFDRVKQSSVTSGTGVLSLLDAAPSFVNFRNVYNNGDTVPYAIVSATAFEVGIGTYISPNQLARTVVLANSLQTASFINFDAAIKDVFVTIPAHLTPILNQAPSGTNLCVVWDGTKFVLAEAPITQHSSNTDVLFNNNNIISGDPDFTWDKITKTLTVKGNIQAYDKSFVIAHPSKKNYILEHGCLEGPEHGVYIRGNVRDKHKKTFIFLPEYFCTLTQENYTVLLTSKNRNHVYVSEKNDYGFEIARSNLFSVSPIDCEYLVIGQRQSIDIEREK